MYAESEDTPGGRGIIVEDRIDGATEGTSSAGGNIVETAGKEAPIGGSLTLL